MPWRNFQGPEFGTKFQREVPLFMEIPVFPFNTGQDRWKEAHISLPKTSSIRSPISIEHRLVTTQTDRHRAITSTHAGIASRGQKYIYGKLTQTGTRSIAISVSLCPFSCLKNYILTPPNFLCILFVSGARSSVTDNAIRYVLPVLWMTSC